MIVHTRREPRFSGPAIALPRAQDFLDRLAECMVGKQAHKPLRVTYEVVNSDKIVVEELTLHVITAVEFSPFSEHMAVAGKDNEFKDFVLRLRRHSASSSKILTNYIEIY